MKDDDREKLRSNPEKGTNTSDKDSDKKDSKKSESKNKSKEDANSRSDERPARFFAKKEDTSDEKKSFFDTDNTADNDEQREQSQPDNNENGVESKEVKTSNGVENEQDEVISEGEARGAVSQVAQARQEDIADNLTRVEPESPEEAEELAAAAYLTNVERHLGSGEDVSEEMLDIATQETLEDLSYNEENDTNETLASDTVVDDTEDSPKDDENVAQQLHTQQQQQRQQQNQNNQNNQNQQQNTNQQNPPPPPPPPPIPPIPPIPPQPPNPGSPNTPSPPAPPYGGGFYNYYPNQPNNNTTNSTVHNSSGNNYNYRRRRAKHLLIGGIVGYVIGRRGGRKRTEKRLQPKIEKLEKQVTTLHDELVVREEHIRTVAKKQAERERALVLAATTNRSEHTKKSTEKTQKEAKKEQVDTSDLVQVEAEPQEKTTAVTSNKERIEHFVLKQQERITLTEKKKTTKRMESEGSIQKMAETHLAGLGMFVERRTMDGSENSRKRFEVMSEQEIKEQAKDIVVDGVAVVAAYEAGRIDKGTLLEVTKRYWRKGSGSYETVLRNNLKPDEKVLATHREKLEKARGESAHIPKEKQGLTVEQKAKAAGEHAKSLAEDFYSRDPSTFTTEEEKQAYFQRFADESAQASELGTLLKKAQNGSLIKHKTGWLTLLAVLVIAAVIWLIMQSRV